MGLDDSMFDAKDDNDFKENRQYVTNNGTRSTEVKTTAGNQITNNTTLTTNGNFVKSDESDPSNYAFSFSHTITYSQLAAMADGGTGSSTITTVASGAAGSDQAYRNLTPLQDGKSVNDMDFLSIKVNPPEKHCIIQCAPDAGDEYEIDITWSPLSLSIANIAGADLSTTGRCLGTITLAKEALKIISEVRSDFGAYQNRLEHSKKYVDNTAENTQASESRIRDTDMAKEMTEMTNADIIAQAGQMILSQANQTPQGVLQLLQ
jgi:flagellin-like hook-associated protein FlgL